MKSGWILAAALLAAAPAFAVPSSNAIAVADSKRPADDKALDAERKPAEMLVLSKVRPGAKVMDLMPGHGYFTRLFSVAVGPAGYVYAYQTSDFDGMYKDKPFPITAVASEYKNVSVIHAAANDLTAPEALDLVWTSQNYHDLHNKTSIDLAVFNRKVFEALKHGGLYVVLDHAAEKGSGLRDTNTLHRIDEATVRSEVEAAGFKLVRESKTLRNPADDRKLKVFDPAIRHKTDQFILVFRKP